MTDPVERAHAERDWARSIALRTLRHLDDVLRGQPTDSMRARLGTYLAVERARLHGPDNNLERGTIVQIVKPAADGTTANVGMLGFVETEGPAPTMPDEGGVHVFFQWHDAALSGAISRDRLRVVGAIADVGELRAALRETWRLASSAVELGWSIKNNPSTDDADERLLVNIRAALAKFESLARTEHDGAKAVDGVFHV